MQLRMQAKQFENEAKRLNKEATKERNKAKAALKKGNRAAAQLYAQNAVRYEQQANNLLQSAATTQGYATDIGAARVTAQMNRNMAVATHGLQQNVAAVNVDKVAAQRSKLDQLHDKVNVANQLVTGESDLSVQAEGDDLLAAIEMENMEEMSAAMDEIPMGAPAVAAPVQPTKMKY